MLQNKRSLSKPLLFRTLAIFTLLITSCSELTPIEETEIENMNIIELAEYINKYVGDAKADSPEFCNTIPIGVKPCGGPWGYLVFSTKTVNEEVLINLVERYNELDSLRNEEEQRMSTCDLATKPNLTIKNNRCFGEGYAWNPGDIIQFN